MATRVRTLSSSDREAHKRLRALWDGRRKDLKLTQQQLAERWDVTQGLVGQYLNGHLPLGVVATLRFAEALNCRPDEIRRDFVFNKLLPGELSPDAVEIALLWTAMPADLRDDLRKTIDRYSVPSYLQFLRESREREARAKVGA
jgi:transcriptional regulator with XRE-family HTH domain